MAPIAGRHLQRLAPVWEPSAAAPADEASNSLMKERSFLSSTRSRRPTAARGPTREEEEGEDEEDDEEVYDSDGEAEASKSGQKNEWLNKEKKARAKLQSMVRKVSSVGSLACCATRSKSNIVLAPGEGILDRGAQREREGTARISRVTIARDTQQFRI